MAKRILTDIAHCKPTVRQSQKTFLAALSQTGTIGAAAQLCGIDPHTPSRWIRKYPKFKEEFDTIKEHAERYVVADAIEAEFDRRALAGKEDGQSAIIGMFRLKRINPAYRDNAQMNVTVHGPVAIQFNLLTPAPAQAIPTVEQAEVE
jgi:transposase-like protein